MFLSDKTMHLLVTSGLEPERLVAILQSLRDDEAATAKVDEARERKRERDRARMAAKRAEEEGDKSDVAATSPKSPMSPEPSDSRRDTSCAHVRDNLPRLVTTGLTDADDERERASDWPAGKATQHAKLLIAEVASPWLDPAKTSLALSEGRLHRWREDGASWEHDVLPVVRGICAKARKPIKSWSYFDDAIAQSIADNRRALEIPEAGKVIPLARGQGPPSLTDRIAAEHAEARRIALETD